MLKEETPVVFFVFNRPDLTRITFEAIKKQKPKKLYIVADGPRDLHPDDKNLCEETLKIVENIDWPCEVKRNYSKTNMGCGARVFSGIEWVFKQEEQIIVIEDDCLPNPDFFIFMEEMLFKYKDNPKIGSVCGFSPSTEELKKYKHDYYFSVFFDMWGWGTWKRAWKGYDFKLNDCKRYKELGWIDGIVGDQKIAKQYKRDFVNLHYTNGGKRKVNTWDIQFMYKHFKDSVYCIKPSKNLIENLGVGRDDAVHTKDDVLKKHVFLENIDFPISHPSEEIRDRELDLGVCRKYVFRNDKFYTLKLFIISNTYIEPIAYYIYSKYKKILNYLRKKIINK